VPTPINRLEQPGPQLNQYGVCTDIGFITSQTATPVRNIFWTRDVSLHLDANFVHNLFVTIIVWRDTVEMVMDMPVISVQFRVEFDILDKCCYNCTVQNFVNVLSTVDELSLADGQTS